MELKLPKWYECFFEFHKERKRLTYYIKDARVTTADANNPDYYIRIRKGKLVPGGKIVASLSNLYIADVLPRICSLCLFPCRRQ